MYNFISLWIRAAWIIMLLIIGISLVFILGKKLSLSIKIAMVILFAIIFGIGFADVCYSIYNPKIEIITGTFENEGNTGGINPFQVEYCFQTDNRKVFIDSDIISMKIIFDNELIEGQLYKIAYESKQNLIIFIES